MMSNKFFALIFLALAGSSSAFAPFSNKPAFAVVSTAQLSMGEETVKKPSNGDESDAKIWEDKSVQPRRPNPSQRQSKERWIHYGQAIQSRVNLVLWAIIVSHSAIET